MKVRSTLVWALVLVVTLFSQSSFSGSRGKNKQTFPSLPTFSNQFPLGPDANITPGKLCDHPTTHRYPEGVAYCERDVDTTIKKEVIAIYDSSLGFSIQKMNRGDFKIDHYFPLCAGGSNDVENLWPQHKSVYAITDPLEPEICAKMAQGLLKQADAIKLVIEAKNHLEKAPQIIDYVRGL